MGLSDYMNFDQYIFRKIINIVHAIVLVCSIIGMLISLVSGIKMIFTQSYENILYEALGAYPAVFLFIFGLIVIPVIYLIIRLYLEKVDALFNIREELQNVAEMQQELLNKRKKE